MMMTRRAIARTLSATMTTMVMMRRALAQPNLQHVQTTCMYNQTTNHLPGKENQKHLPGQFSSRTAAEEAVAAAMIQRLPRIDPVLAGICQQLMQRRGSTPWLPVERLGMDTEGGAGEAP